jgi:hypothetical protein
VPDPRDVALDDRIADRGSVPGISVRVQQQMEPLLPADRVTEPDFLGHLRRQQRHPRQRRERQVLLSAGRAGRVPIDEAGAVAAAQPGARTARIDLGRVVDDLRAVGRVRPAGARIALIFAFAGLFGLGETVLAPTLTPLVNTLAAERVRGRVNAMSTVTVSMAFVASRRCRPG